MKVNEDINIWIVNDLLKMGENIISSNKFVKQIFLDVPMLLLSDQGSAPHCKGHRTMFKQHTTPT